MQYSITSYKDTFPNKNFRLEAEFYVSKRFSGINHFLGEDVIDFVQYGTSNALNEESNGYPTLRLNEFDSCFITTPSKYCDLITDEIYQSLRLIKDDVLICRTNGNPKLVGKSAIVMEDTNFAFASYLFRVRPKKSKVLSAYLTVYLNSKIGRQEIEKYSMQSNQANFSPAKFREIAIPALSLLFQEQIVTLVKSSYYNAKQAKSIYYEVQTLLLSELGLLDWKPKHQLSFAKNYSDTQQAGRFDAEYFQPKYEEIVNAIKNYAGGWDTLGNLVSLKKCIEVGSEEYSDGGIPFVRVSNLSPFEITEEKYISEKLYSELTPKEEADVTFEMSKNHQPKKGEILFSKDATPGLAYFLSEEPQKMIPSGGILRLKPKDKRIKPSYLTLVLNALIVQEQIDRDVGGSVILHWRPDQVEKTLIPILKEDKQDEIQQKITESFNLRKQSKHLLECAKKAVEMAIEKDEETAMQWLESQIDSIERGN